MDKFAIVLVKPPSYNREGVVYQVEKMIKEAGLEIVETLLRKINSYHAERLYSKHKGKDYYPWLITQITSGISCIFLVRGENVAQRVRDLAGPTEPEKARIESPNSIRALLTPDWESFKRSREEKRAVDNVVHTSDPKEDGSVAREGLIFFPQYYV